MSVTVEPDCNPVTNDQVLLRAEEIKLCKLFNEKYSKGIESSRRMNLKQRIDKLLPRIQELLLEVKAVSEGERKRFNEALDKMAEQEYISDEDMILVGDVDKRTAAIWDCCEALYYDYTAKCQYCGNYGLPSTSLDDVEGILTELSGLLADSDTKN